MAVVALFGLLSCLVNLVISIIKYFSWKNKIHVIGTVTELKDTKIKYKNGQGTQIESTDYVYNIQVKHDKYDYSVEYVESVAGNRPGKILLNSSLPIFIDDRTNEVKLVKDVTNQIWQWGLCSAGCFVAFILCLLAAM